MTRDRAWGLALVVLVLVGVVVILVNVLQEDRLEPLEFTEYPFDVGIHVQPSPDIFDLWVRTVDRDLHMNWMKLPVRWAEIETAPSVYDWNSLDFSIPYVAEYGLNLLVVVSDAPSWARPDTVDQSLIGPPADPQTYADFVAALLQRYPGMIHALEVWEGMNTQAQWANTAPLSAADYLALLKPTYEAVKRVAPDVDVISGALAVTGHNDGVVATDDLVYLTQMIEAGLLEAVDCVGMSHLGMNIGPGVAWNAVTDDPSAQFRGPFENPHRVWSFLSTLEAYLTALESARSTLPLCVTRFGWASAEDLDGVPEGFEFALDNTLAEQRDWTIEALDYMAVSGRVRLAFVWNLNYGPQAGWDPQNSTVPYSIIGPGTSFRPVFDALAAWEQADAAAKAD